MKPLGGGASIRPEYCLAPVRIKNSVLDTTMWNTVCKA